MRERAFDALARLAGSRPWFVLLGALVLTVVTGALSENLKLETRVLDLLPASDPAAVEYNEIVNHYSSATQIIVGVKGDDRASMIAFVDELDRRAAEATYADAEGATHPYVKRITVRADVDFIEQHGLMLTKQRDLENIDELYQDLDLAPLLAAYNDFLEREYIEDSAAVTEREKEDRAIDGLKNVVEWLAGVEQADGDPQAVAALAERVTDDLTIGEPYMFSDDDKMLLALVQPAISIDHIEENMAGAASLREVVRDIQARHPELDVRMTGMPMLALEEGEVAFGDMGLSSLVSLALVFALFVLAFRMWTAPLLAVINLLLGITWTSGFIALTFARLNLFTLMFAVILIGLGIDFAIHLNAAFSTARSEGKDVQEALRAMFRRAGAGVVTGALTTAAAFLALALSGLDALVELGVVLGVGILLTLVSSLTVLPALYAIHGRIADRRAARKNLAPRPVRLALPFLASLGALIARRPAPVLVVFVVLTAGLGWLASRAEFEPDMLEMEPPDMPSVVLHREILDRFEINPDFAIVTAASLEEARPIVEKMKQNRLVGRVDAITELVPAEQEQRRRARIVAAIRERMTRLAEPKLTVGLPGAAAIIEPPAYETTEQVPDAQAQQLLDELDRLQLNVQEIGQLAFASMKNRLHRTCERLTGGATPGASAILGLKQRLAADRAGLPRRIARYQRAYVPRLAAKLARMADPSPITVATLPAAISERYLAADGRNLITIYAAVDLWREDKMELFNQATARASARVTGTAVLVDRLIDLIGSKGLMATFFALGAVFLILLVDFRHLGHALLGTLPLLVGFTWMVGLFVALGRKFDVANVEAIPLILGIGIDDAVHVIHAVRRQGIGELPNVLRHTGRALILTSLTTAIAFGSIATSAHVGLAGMGLLLVLGVGSCLIASLFLLPALLRIFLGRKQSNPTRKEAPDAA